VPVQEMVDEGNELERRSEMIYLLALSGSGASVLAAVVWTTVLAFRDEHVVALHWRDRGVMFLERAAGGRYETCGPAQLPGAVWRYSGLRVRGAFAQVRGRAAERRHVLFHPHKA
jgi:hypothetical protein